MLSTTEVAEALNLSVRHINQQALRWGLGKMKHGMRFFSKKDVVFIKSRKGLRGYPGHVKASREAGPTK